MTTILVKRATTETYSNLGRYFYCEMESGKHAAMIAVNPRGLQVIVQNSSHRVWRGMGKQFPNVAAALAAYKTAAIRAMIEHAAELDKVTP